MATLPASLTAPPFIAGVVTPSRYRRSRHIERLDGKEVLTARPRIPNDLRIDDLYHVWADGEWLDQLAYKYYRDSTLWWVIADFNLITECRQIDVGRTLRLPNQRRLLLDILPLVK